MDDESAHLWRLGPPRADSTWDFTHPRRAGLRTTGMDTTHGLTRRERVILAHLALPLTLGEIAGSLFVTRNTVKSQVRSIYLKLGVADRESALTHGRRLGLVPADLGMPDLGQGRRRLTEVPHPAVQTSTR